MNSLNLKNNFYINNKFLLLIFTFFYIIFSFYLINQYSLALSNVDFYSYFFGDGHLHITLIDNIDKKINLTKIHHAKSYHNNYYLFSLIILKLLKILPGFDFATVGLSAVILNLFSIYIICTFGYLISYKLSESKILSLGLVFFLWNENLISFGIRIYPDILQLAFIIISIFFVTTKYKLRWFLSFLFCGLAFGVKSQGLLIFLYLIGLYSMQELFLKDFKNFKHLIFSKFLLKIFFYTFVFLIIFFIFNQINLFDFAKSVFSISSLGALTKTEIKEYNNFVLVNKYFFYLFNGKSNFLLFAIIVISGLIFLIKKKEKNILFIVSILFLILFYFQLIFMKPLVQGPRYLFHLLPLILILFSISYKNLSNLFINKYFSIIIAVASIFILYQGFDLFKKNFLYTIKYKNFKVRIKNDMAFPAYKYLNEIPKDLKKDLNLCATSWSVTPSGFKKKYIVSSFIINLESKIKSKECDLLLLDSWTVGRFTWYKGDIKNIISKKFDKLGPFERKDGRDIVYKNQKLTEYILQEEQSGFKVVFFNPRIVILKKNNLTNF